jgi:predicted lipoprotein
VVRIHTVNSGASCNFPSGSTFGQTTVDIANPDGVAYDIPPNDIFLYQNTQGFGITDVDGNTFEFSDIIAVSFELMPTMGNNNWTFVVPVCGELTSTNSITKTFAVPSFTGTAYYSFSISLLRIMAGPTAGYRLIVTPT